MRKCICWHNRIANALYFTLIIISFYCFSETRKLFTLFVSNRNLVITNVDTRVRHFLSCKSVFGKTNFVTTSLPIYHHGPWLVDGQSVMHAVDTDAICNAMECWMIGWWMDQSYTIWLVIGDGMWLFIGIIWNIEIWNRYVDCMDIGIGIYNLIWFWL